MNIKEFLIESNAIEGIHRELTQDEVAMTDMFLTISEITIDKLVVLNYTYQPNARLRTSPGMNVMVGGHMCPYGGPSIGYMLEELLEDINEGLISPFVAHVRYEKIHPFTDGNGRTGRALWLWMMEREFAPYYAPMGFLQTIYYQMMEESGNKL